MISSDAPQLTGKIPMELTSESSSISNYWTIPTS